MKFSRLSLLFALLFILISLVGCSNPEKDKEAHYQKALEYINKSDNKAAIIELRNAVDIDGKLAKAHYQLALLYLKEENPEKAFKSFHRTASLNPDNYDAGIKLAEFYLISHKKDESRKYTELVLSRKPDHYDGLVLLANLELIDGNYDKAQEIVDKTFENHPKSAKLYNLKGRIYVGKKQYDLAEEMLKKAVEFGSDNYANYRTLLLFYQRSKDDEKISSVLDEMIKNFPDNPEPHLILSSFHNSKKKFDLAEKELKLAIETKNDNPQLHLILVDFYKNLRKYATAESYLQEITAKIPDSLDLKIALADIQFQMRKYDQARGVLDNVLKENELHGGANLIKIKFLIKDEKYRDAISILTPLIRDYPHWAEPSFQLAIAHLQLGEIKLAQQAIEQALQNSPTSSKYHTFLARVFLLQGEGESAGKEATIAIRLDSRNFQAAVILTQALIQERRYKEAVNVLTRMLEKRPDHPGLLYNLSMAYLGLKDYKTGEQTLKKLLNITPGNHIALSLLASLVSKNEPAKGIDVIQNYIEKSPESGGHQLLLGNYFLRSGSPEKAMVAFRKAQELSPDNPEAYLAIGSLLSKQGKGDLALDEYRNLLKSSPNNVPARMGMAIILESQDKSAEAIAIYQEILQIKQNFAPAANNLAWLLSNTEEADLGEALRLAMTAKKAYPRSPDISDTLGWVHYKRKSYSLAITQFEYAVSLKPETGVFLYHLALSQSQKQENTKAIANLEKALNSSGVFKEKEKAKELLAQLRKQVQ